MSKKLKTSSSGLSAPSAKIPQWSSDEEVDMKDNANEKNTKKTNNIVMSASDPAG